MAKVSFKKHDKSAPTQITVKKANYIRKTSAYKRAFIVSVVLNIGFIVTILLNINKLKS